MTTEQIKSLVIVVLLVACLSLAYFQFSGQGIGGAVSAETAVENALAFINKKILAGEVEAVLTGEIVEEKGLYKFEMEIEGQNYPAYVTRDGGMLFPQAGLTIDLEEKELAKEDSPKLEAFVVSYCPFGLQMQRILSEVIKAAPGLEENIEIRYIGSVQNGEVQAMHGEQEAQENLKQICLREEQQDKFIPYLFCFLKEGQSEECLQEVGADEGELASCMETAERGVSYAEEDFKLADDYQVTGSPSLILNTVRVSEFDFGGRTAEAVKELLCSGFKQEPEACSITMATEQAATGFSLEYAGEGSGGSCD